MSLLGNMIYNQSIRYDCTDKKELTKANIDTLKALKNNSGLKFIKREGSDNLYYTYDINLFIHSSRDIKHLQKTKANFHFFTRCNIPYFSY